MQIDIPDDTIRKAVLGALLGEGSYSRPLHAVANAVMKLSEPELERIFAEEFRGAIESLREPMRQALREAILEGVRREGARIGVKKARKIGEAVTMFEEKA